MGSSCFGSYRFLKRLLTSSAAGGRLARPPKAIIGAASPRDDATGKTDGCQAAAAGGESSSQLRSSMRLADRKRPRPRRQHGA